MIGIWVGRSRSTAPRTRSASWYNGPNREKNLEVIRRHHVVITTIVALEYSDETDGYSNDMCRSACVAIASVFEIHLQAI